MTGSYAPIDNHARVRFYDATAESEIILSKKDYDASIKKLMKKAKVSRDIASKYLHYSYWKHVQSVYGTPSTMKFVLVTE
jgi:hypothetical protein